MSSSGTSIRLITTGDADAITEHIVRDRETQGRWEPAYSQDYYTLDGQRQRIERMLASHRGGRFWPTVILDGQTVIGQITVQEILQRAWRKASIATASGPRIRGRVMPSARSAWWPG
jgi:RimJ/RimL family protein N-acetyltransferase